MAASRERVGAVVVAAGQSRRMGGRDKIFAPILGQPLIAFSLEKLQRCPQVDEVILVLNPQNQDQGRRLVEERGWSKVQGVCLGGEQRQASVWEGLRRLSPCHWVLVHDGARPCWDIALIQRGLEAARETGCAVPALPLRDTVKEVAPSGIVSRTLDRNRLWTVQTPQVFRYHVLWEAYRWLESQPQAGKGLSQEELFTDDASLVERLGHSVKVFPGSPANIKVTTAEDLALVETLLRFASGTGR